MKLLLTMSSSIASFPTTDDSSGNQMVHASTSEVAASLPSGEDAAPAAKSREESNEEKIPHNSDVTSQSDAMKSPAIITGDAAASEPEVSTSLVDFVADADATLDAAKSSILQDSPSKQSHKSIADDGSCFTTMTENEQDDPKMPDVQDYDNGMPSRSVETTSENEPRGDIIPTQKIGYPCVPSIQKTSTSSSCAASDDDWNDDESLSNLGNRRLHKLVGVGLLLLLIIVVSSVLGAVLTQRTENNVHVPAEADSAIDSHGASPANNNIVRCPPAFGLLFNVVFTLISHNAPFLSILLVLLRCMPRDTAQEKESLQTQPIRLPPRLARNKILILPLTFLLLVRHKHHRRLRRRCQSKHMFLVISSLKRRE